jgi:galactokinase/mevalonate kinase-like predicted kinase
MIQAITNGRAGIIGNPTDGYGGTMIACSIKNRAIATIATCDELIIQNKFGQTKLRFKGDFENKGDYFDIVRCVLRYFKAYDLKAKITTDSNIPLQAGLAGSTSILSSVLNAVMAYLGEETHKYKVAEINRAIELNYLKCHCGYQDAYMTTFGGLNYLDFRGKENYKKWNDEQYATVENLSYIVDDMPFVIAHTGIKHHSGNFHKPLRERWMEGDKAVVNGYNEIMNIAREGKKAIINQNWTELAYLMNKNHSIQDSLTDSGTQNNVMIKVAKENGCLAAKLAGAGGGGTIIALTEDIERAKKALSEVGAEEFIEFNPKSRGVVVKEIDDVAHNDYAV